MKKIDSRPLTFDGFNERRRRAVKMRLDGNSLKAVAVQCETSRATVIAPVKAYGACGWKAVEVARGGHPVGRGHIIPRRNAESSG